MTPLRKHFIEDLNLKSLSPSTQKSYLTNVIALSKYFNKSPEDLESEDLRSYFVYLKMDKHYAANTIGQHVSAIRFIWETTLSRTWEFSELIKNKRPKKLPIVLSEEEVSTIIHTV